GARNRRIGREISISRADFGPRARPEDPRKGSALASGTVGGRPRTLADRFYCGAANPAGQPFAPVHEVIELEIPGLAAAVDIVAQRRAPFCDRIPQRL